ncbi:MAG: hypothetical protein U5L96_10440 [Owenweeksia sp.]|nr:hypothetical protein [Owenweeksia sp.]
MGRQLKQLFGNRVLGPEFPLIARLRNQYQMEIMLKLEEGVSLKKVKGLMLEAEGQLFAKNPKLKVQVVYDVDPM